jgi:hypothetical protein
MSNPADQFLLGSKTRSAKFDTIGDTVTGVILSTAVQQQTDINTGVPLFWDSDSPRMQLVVRLQTLLREEPDENGIPDDGVRNVYVKGSKKVGTRSMHDAVATAVRQAGGKGLEEGGTLTVTFVGEEPPSQRGLSPRKLWEATYVQPDRAAQSGSFLGTAQLQDAHPSTSGAKVFPPATLAPTEPTPQSKDQQAAFAAWMESQSKTV